MSSLRSAAISSGLSVLSAIYLRRLKRLPDLDRLIGALQKSNSDATGVSAADYLALYEAIVEYKPKQILELGAGRSSAVIAFAAEKIGLRQTDFIAIEGSPMWLEDHKRTIPADLLSKMDLRLNEPETCTNWGERASFYKELPIMPYEFVHVDGPPLVELGSRVSCDILNLLPYLGERCLITFDAREDTARFCSGYLKAAGFRVSRHPFTMSYQFRR